MYGYLPSVNINNQVNMWRMKNVMASYEEKPCKTYDNLDDDRFDPCNDPSLFRRTNSSEIETSFTLESLQNLFFLCLVCLKCT